VCLQQSLKSAKQNGRHLPAFLAVLYIKKEENGYFHSLHFTKIEHKLLYKWNVKVLFLTYKSFPLQQSIRSAKQNGRHLPANSGDLRKCPPPSLLPTHLTLIGRKSTRKTTRCGVLKI